MCADAGAGSLSTSLPCLHLLHPLSNMGGAATDDGLVCMFSLSFPGSSLSTNLPSLHMEVGAPRDDGFVSRRVRPSDIRKLLGGEFR